MGLMRLDVPNPIRKHFLKPGFKQSESKKPIIWTDLRNMAITAVYKSHTGLHSGRLCQQRTSGWNGPHGTLLVFCGDDDRNETHKKHLQWLL